MSQMHAPVDTTPWGKAQNRTLFSDGIVLFSAAAHGGYWVPKSTISKWPAALRDFKTIDPPQWFEEDCEAAIVVCAMPDLTRADTGKPAFDDYAVFSALRMLLRIYGSVHRDFICTIEGQALSRRCAAFEAMARQQEWYEHTASMTNGDGWVLWYAAIAPDLVPARFMVRVGDTRQPPPLLSRAALVEMGAKPSTDQPKRG